MSLNNEYEITCSKCDLIVESNKEIKEEHTPYLCDHYNCYWECKRFPNRNYTLHIKYTCGHCGYKFDEKINKWDTCLYHGRSGDYYF